MTTRVAQPPTLAQACGLVLVARQGIDEQIGEVMTTGSARETLRGMAAFSVGRALMAALVLAVFLFAAARAEAHHSPSALYTGTHSGGGTVEFDVSADGSAITRYKFVGLPCQDGSFIDFETTGTSVPIANHGFYVADAEELFSGSFSQTQAAAGSYQSLGATGAGDCLTDVVSWTATTTAPARQCSDGIDNDGDGLVDFGADHGCLDGLDDNETDPDITDPVLVLSGKKAQKLGKSVSVRVACPGEACTARATGRVSVPAPKAARRYKLRGATATLPSGGAATLKLKHSRAASAAIKLALGRGAKVTAQLTVSVLDAAGNRTTKRRKITLKA